MSEGTCSCSAFMAGECCCGAWDEPSDEVASLQQQLAARTAECDALRAARDAAVEIAENMHHTLTNGLCRRCEDSVRVCDLEELDKLREVGKEAT